MASNLHHSSPPASDAIDLAMLGLDPEVLLQARSRAQLDVDDCTDFDAPGFAGFTRTSRTVRYLREELIPQGWTTDDAGNQASVVSPDGTHAVIVTSGDEGTGDLDRQVKTKYPKGDVTDRRVAANLQLALFGDEADPESPPERHTWVLLQHCAGDRVHAELSLPTGSDPTGRISTWRERIVLEPLILDQPVTTGAAPGHNEEIAVDVTPR